MSYDPPEPTEDELDEYATKRAVMEAPTIRIEGLTADAVAVVVRHAIESNYDLRETAEAAIREEVASVVNTLASELVRDRIAKEVDAVLVEGWVATNQWGEPTGKRTTLREMIAGTLTARVSREYDMPEETFVSRVVRKQVKEALEKSFAEDLARAKDALKAQVDELLKAKLVASLREALGLR